MIQFKLHCDCGAKIISDVLLVGCDGNMIQGFSGLNFRLMVISFRETGEIRAKQI